MEQTEHCPKMNGFKLWIAFVVGMAVMILAAAFFQWMTNRGQGTSSEPNPTTTQAELGTGGETDLISLIAAQDEEKSWLGVEVQTIDETEAQQFGLQSGGLLVNRVMKGSPAEAAGIQRGDVIIMFDRRMVENTDQLQELMEETTPGARVKTMVMSAEGRQSLYVTLGSTTAQTIASEDEDNDRGKYSWGIVVSPAQPIVGKRFGVADQGNGVMVVTVASGSSAENAGLQPGDIITSINQQPTPNMTTFFAALDDTTGDKVMLDVTRQDQNLYIVIEPVPDVSGGRLIGGDKTGATDSDDEEEGGYKGMPPVIPPKGKSIDESEDNDSTKGIIVSITDPDGLAELHDDKPQCKRLPDVIQ